MLFANEENTNNQQQKSLAHRKLKHPFLTGIVILAVLIGGFALFASSGDENTGENGSAASQEAAAPATPEDRIRNAVTKVLSGTANTKKEKFKKVDIVQQVDGGYGAFVEFNVDENLSTNLTKQGMEIDMSEVYQALYAQDLNVTSASVSAYFTLIDQYGNQSDDLVYKTILDKPEADKINWNADSATLRIDIVPGVWTTSFLHRAFQE